MMSTKRFVYTQVVSCSKQLGGNTFQTHWTKQKRNGTKHGTRFGMYLSFSTPAIFKTSYDENDVFIRRFCGNFRWTVVKTQ